MSKQPYAILNEPRFRAARKEFARRLQAALNAKKWSQSDLARATFGSHVDKATGYTVATGRDRISAYLQAKSLPEPKTAQKLADALGVKVDELMPPPPIVAQSQQPTRIENVRKHDVAEIVANLMRQGLYCVAMPMTLDASLFMIEVR
jgi:transcriptional regulator with XRE-family HTH domain